MLEDGPYLISRVFESSSDQESNWHYLAYQFHESLNKKKRQLDEEMPEEEDQNKRKNLSHQLAAGDMDQPLNNSDYHTSNEAYDNPSAFDRLTRDLVLSYLLLLSRSDYGTVASVSRAVRSMNSPRCLFGSASRGGKAIVAGGTNGCEILNSVELYNSETQTWESLPAMHRARKLCSGMFMEAFCHRWNGKRKGGVDARRRVRYEARLLAVDSKHVRHSQRRERCTTPCGRGEQ